MKLLKILQVPDATLKKKTRQINDYDLDRPEIRNLIEDMKYTLIKQEDPKGVGLSAPQVGKSLQIFVIREEDSKPFRVFINPIITLKYSRKVILEDKPEPLNLEGCLSIRDIWGVVDRAPIVKITYMNEYGEVKTETIGGFLAHVVQHEYDHLQGILFPQRVEEAGRSLYHSEKDDKNEEIFTIIDKDKINSYN